MLCSNWGKLSAPNPAHRLITDGASSTGTAVVVWQGRPLLQQAEWRRDTKFEVLGSKFRTLQPEPLQPIYLVHGSGFEVPKTSNFEHRTVIRLTRRAFPASPARLALIRHLLVI